jgi:hypothetical protein
MSQETGAVRRHSARCAAFIGSEIHSLVNSADFVEAIPGFLLPDAASQSRRAILEELLKAIAAPK